METITKSAEETFELGRKIGSGLKGGETIALVGELGSGKTTFIQGLAKSLGITNQRNSPTFILMRNYKTQTSPPIQYLYHLDLYRLEEEVASELQNLGIFDVWGKNENVVVLEWADKAKGVYPANTRWIYFEYLDQDKRKITIKE